MKKIFIIFLGLLISSSIFAGVEDWVPADVQFFGKTKSAKNFIKSVGLDGNKFFGESLVRMKRNMKKEIKVNLLDIKDLQRVGVDVNREVGFFATNVKIKSYGNPNMVLAFLIPVKNDKLLNLFDKVIQAENSRALRKATNNGVFFKMGDRFSVYFLKKNNYLCMILGTQNVEELADRVNNESSSLGSDAGFLKLKSELTGKGDSLLYANMNSFVNNNPNILDRAIPMGMGRKLMGLLKEYKQILIKTNLKNKDLRLKIATNMDEGSKILDIYKGVDFNKTLALGIRKKLIAFMSISINIDAYVNLLKNLYPPMVLNKMKTQFAMMEKLMGIDLKRDLQDNLTGSVNVSVYPDKKMLMVPYTTVFTMGIKNKKVALKLLSKLMKRVPPQRRQMISKIKDGYKITVMHMLQMYLFVHKNQLVFTIGRNMYNQIKKVRSPKAISLIKDKVLKSIIKKPYQMAYIRSEELGKLFKSLLSMMPGGGGMAGQVAQVLSMFNHFISYGKVNGNVISGELILKTKFRQPFFKTLSSMFQ